MLLAWWSGADLSDEETEIELRHSGHADDPASEFAVITAAKADPRAFAPLYHAYAPAILRYCQRQLGHAELANDATAQTFTKAIAALGRFDTSASGNNPGATFRSWLFTIAHNVIVDLHRRNRRHLSLDNEPTSTWLHASKRLTDPATSPEDQAIASERAQRLHAMLAALPERQRRIVELRLAGLSGIEIAASMGMTHGAVKSAQARAYSTLRDLLRDQHLHPESDHGPF
jgi:RNA polymerase sigma-70 factor (ECF subfamily)